MKRILLLLANGFEMFEASAFIDVMGWNLIDGDILTSWNPSTAHTVALKLLELLTSKENSVHISKIMGFSD